jgi:tetratricopeptide (TPR) repeat protein
MTRPRLKNASRLIIPVLILLFTFFYNPHLGTVFLVGYIIYLAITSRSSFFTWLAIRDYNNSDWEGALKWFVRAAKNKRANATVLLSYSLVLLKTGDFERAERNVERASELELSDYNRKVVESMRGLLEWKTGNPRKAATALSRLAEEFENSTLYGALGSLYLSQGMLDRALRHNEAAYEMDEYDKIIGDTLARTYYLKGDVAKAEELWDDLIERAVQLPEPYLNKAILLSERGEEAAAEEMRERAGKYPLSALSYFSGKIEDSTPVDFNESDFNESEK